MQRILRIIAVVVLSAISLETVFWFLDVYLRWQWVGDFVKTHPHLESVLHSPVLPFIFLWAFMAVQWFEKKLKMPEFVVEFCRIEPVPQLSGITETMVAED